MVPLCFMVALGSLFLHLKHTMVKRDSNMEKNTINLGSSSDGVPVPTLKINGWSSKYKDVLSE